MKQLLLATILLFSTLTLVAQDYARVSKAEFERHRHRYNQLFDTNAFSPEERLQVIDTYYNTILSDQEKDLFAQGALTIQVGRFFPSAIKGVYIQHPIEGHSRMYLNDMLYMYIPCDTYALSRDGLLATGSFNLDSLQGHLTIVSLQGWEIASLSPFNLSFTPYDFNWVNDEWLYFRGGYDYYKTRVTPPAHRENCLMDDIEISHHEYLVAQSHAKRYNLDRYDRQPTAADTAAVRQFAHNDNILYAIVLEELYAGQFGEGGPAFVELAVGDNCCTRLLGDTVCMPACNMVLSASHFLAGINTVWGAGPAEMPAFIYIYPYPADSRHVGVPFIYQTTPRWTPSHYFWGEDDWLFVEGWNPQTQQSCYHKVRLPSSSRR